MKQIIISLLLLCSSQNITLSNYWQETPLMHAAAHADIAKMKELIRSGADVNAVYGLDFPHAGKPVLRYAIDSHSLEAVKVLLETGADVNDITESPLLVGIPTSNVRNLSLLSHAIRTKAPIAMINLLLAHGADVDGNPKIASDWSALMIAVYTGYNQAVEVLLQAGADQTLVNSMDNKTAYDYAVEQGYSEIVALLS